MYKYYINQINGFGITNLIKVPTRLNSMVGTLSNAKLNYKPWIIKEILKSIKRKKTSYTKTFAKIILLTHLKYNKYRNKLTKTIRKSKKNTMKSY